MDAYGDLFSHNYVDNVTPLTAATLNRLFQVFPVQMQGALAGLGLGVTEGLEGDTDGLTYSVTAGSAIVSYALTADEGLVFVTAPDGLECVLPDDSSVWLWLQAAMPDDTDYDARQDATALVVCTATSTQPPNSLPLEHGVTAGGAYTITADDRIVCPARQGGVLAVAVAALEAAVGTPYAGATTIEARLAVLESGGTGGVAANWAGMTKAPGDPTTIEQQIAADLAPLEEDIAALQAAGGSSTGGASIAADPWDVDAVNQARALLAATALGGLHADLPSTQVDAVTIVPGIYGDGSGADAVDFWDRVNSSPPIGPS